MEAECVWCHNSLGNGRGYEMTGEYGNWKGKKVYACDYQCLLLWDTDRPEEGIKGAQAFDMSTVHKMMKSIED
jgi:hypothetical protein